MTFDRNHKTNSRLSFIVAVACLLLWLPWTTVKAQMDINYIYLFDCTKSMDGYGGTPKIFGPAKNFLHEDIAKKPDDASVMVIPFQHKCYNPMAFATRSQFDWKAVEKELDGYVNGAPTRTNIVDAWKEGMHRLNPNAYNVVYLLTDGIDNHVQGRDCVQELCNLIRQSCGKYKNVQLLYVMLTRFAQDPRINEALKTCPDFSVIGTISPNFVVLGKRSFRMNARDGKITVAIPVSDKHAFPVKAQSGSKLFKVSVDGGKAENGVLKLTVERTVSASELRRQPLHLDFPITLSAPKGKAWIINPEVTAEVVNKPEKSLTLCGNTNGTDLGRSGYYASFLFVKESGPDAIGCDLRPQFNDDALKAGSAVTFSVSSDAKNDNDYTVLVNGQPVKDRTFTIHAGDKARLAIVFDKDAEKGKRHFILRPVSVRNLDKINGEEPASYKFIPFGKYSRSMNPLKLALIWAFVIIVALLILWFVVFKHIFFPSFHGVHSYTITEPFYTTRKFKGRRKIVLTDRKPARGQGSLSRMFTGEVYYDVNPLYTKPMELTPCRGGAHLRTGNAYMATSTNGMPSPNIWKKGGEYLIESLESNTKIKVTVI